MKLLNNGLSVIHRFKKIWEGLIESAWIDDVRERYLSRVLNIILLIFLVWGIVFEVQSRLENKLFTPRDTLVLAIIVILVLAYALNRHGQFSAATLLTLGLFITFPLAFVLLQHASGRNNPSVLYYLMIAILIGELFFSIRGYLITVAIVLVEVFGVSLLNINTQSVFLFLLIFCVLIGFSNVSRRSLERQKIALASKHAHDQSMLAMEQRRSAQLSLLEEIGRQIADSLDEKEILEHTLEAVVNRFGYVEAVIYLLVNEDILEIAAISSTQDFGYRPGDQQKISEGIVGHVAETAKVYIADDVSTDPYDLPLVKRTGSAAGVPVLDKDHLLGVIYVESDTRNGFQADDIQTLQTLANQVAISLQKARLYTRTQEHLQVMTTLQSISHTLASLLDEEEILSNVIRLLKDSFGYTYISIYLLDQDILHLGTELGYPDDMLIYEIPITMGVIGRTARSKQTQFVPDVSNDLDFIRASYEVHSEIAVPLLKEEKVLGVLNVESKKHVPLDENDANLLNALAGSIAIAIDNARLHAEVKQMALTDVVSGLANRRAFDEILETEIARANRYQQFISLIIIDLDSFKEYNDKWGHPAGDVRLKEIANLLRANVREPDVAVRYGGEEFAIILPNTSKTGALKLAERLRQSAQSNAPHVNGNDSPISGYTISVGVATFPDDAGSLEDLLLMADNAELTAKRLGKNRVYAANFSDTIQTL